ncbi:MAG: hypothetical protein ACHQHO_00830 [Solirubrobacterales bacterium]
MAQLLPAVPAWLFAWAAAIVLVASFVLLSAMWSRPRALAVLDARHDGRLHESGPMAALLGEYLNVTQCW